MHRRHVGLVFLILMQQHPLTAREKECPDKKRHLSLLKPLDQTALHRAAFNGLTEAMKFFLSQNVPVDIRNENENTPLHYAAVNNQVEAIEVLLNAGANIDAQDQDGTTPILLLPHIIK